MSMIVDLVVIALIAIFTIIGLSYRFFNNIIVNSNLYGINDSNFRNYSKYNKDR